MSVMMVSEMNTLYTRLNTVRKQHGLTELTRSFVANTPTASSGIAQFNTDLNNTSKESKYISTTTYDLGDFSVGAPCKRIIYTNIGTTVDKFESACIYDSNRSNYGDDSPDWSHSDGNYGDRGSDKNYGTVDKNG